MCGSTGGHHAAWQLHVCTSTDSLGLYNVHGAPTMISRPTWVATTKQYDVIKHDPSNVVDRTNKTYQRLAERRSRFVDDAAFTRNCKLLDIDAFIDYMIVTSTLATPTAGTPELISHLQSRCNRKWKPALGTPSMCSDPSRSTVSGIELAAVPSTWNSVPISTPTTCPSVPTPRPGHDAEYRLDSDRVQELVDEKAR